MNEVDSMEKEQLLNQAALLEREPVETILRWAVDTFGDEIVLACSCGPEDLVILDQLTRITSRPKVFFLDTDKHFEETYATKEKLEQKYDFTFIVVKAELTLAEQAATYGANLWEHNPNLCCQLRKVNPLKQILNKYRAWITGIRREQSPTRANAKVVEWDHLFSLMKVNPLVGWTKEDVWTYIRAHDLPYNPLHDQHYPSIGCSVCTKPVKLGEDERAGRWSGHEKTECGLHKG